jgi:hypothetical protein
MAIISHKYRFIFIKTAKTAGTSIEVSLSKLCGPDDIVTPILPPEPGHEPRNFIAPDGTEYYNHMTASKIRAMLGDDRFYGYFKFCVERHPVDKCLSHFAMKKYSEYHRTWRSYFLTWNRYVNEGKFPIDYGNYTDKDSTLLVDRIIKYEDLDHELSSVLQGLGVPWAGLTSRAKGGYRRARMLSADEVKPHHRASIMAAFAASNRLTGYA